MKNCLTNLFKSSIFRYAKRIAIVCVFLSISVAAAGHGGPHTFEVVVKSNPANGAGSVYVAADNSATSGSSSLTLTCDNSNDADDNLSCYLFAKPNSGWAFSNWTLSDSKGTLASPNSSPCQYTINVNDNDGSTETATAKFKPIISINDQENWVDNYKLDIIKSVKEGSVTLYLYKATNFAISESGDDNDYFSYEIEEIPSSETTGSYQLKITLNGDVPIGDGPTYTLKADNGSATLKVSVAEDTYVTFRSNAYLSYQAGYTAGGGITVSNGSAEKTEKLNFKDLTLQVTGTTGSNRFYRWKITRAGASEPIYLYNYLESSSDYSALYNAQNGDTVTVEHIGTAYARFRVDGATSMYYDNLQVALNAATGVDKKIVYVHQSGNVLPDNYTVPAGVTLLVPGDDSETCVIGELKSNDYASVQLYKRNTNNPAGYDNIPTLKKHLTLDNGTNINVLGNICVYAKLTGFQRHNASPVSYGRIKMNGNCQIELCDGAKLMAYGFIIGTYKDNYPQSEIVAHSGSWVYEPLQIRDWAGINATSSILGNKQKIFFMGQYYAQNIETLLRLEHGATEKLSTCVNSSSSSYIAISPTFVSDEGGDGFMRLRSADAVFEKYFIPTKDRLHINLKGTGGTPAKASLENMTFEITSTVKPNSADYVFPINMNISINLDNIDMTIEYDVALLAGSTLNISENSLLTLNGNLFVYDLDQHTTARDENPVAANDWGFYSVAAGGSVSWLHSIVGGTNGWNSRNNNSRFQSDAQIDVNGAINIVGDGMLYTTGTLTPNENLHQGAGGASIVCTEGNGGSINFKTASFDNLLEVTYQGNHNTNNKITPIPLPVTVAQLKNSDGTFVKPDEDTDYNTKFTYVDGFWLPEGNISYSEHTVPSFIFNKPYANENMPSRNIVIEFNESANNLVLNATLPSNPNFQLVSQGWNDDKTQYIISIQYTQSNIHGTYEAEVNVNITSGSIMNPESFPSVIKVTAVENYQPNFSCEVQGNLTKQLCNATNPTAKLMITPGNNDDNVTALLNRYPNDLVWNYEIVGDDKGDFAFAFGDAADLSGAKVTFQPTTSGTKTATLKITAKSEFTTLTDEAAMREAGLIVTKDIELSATAILCSQPIELHNITQLFVGEENVQLIANTGNGSNITIEYDDKFIELSPTNRTSTSYTIKALKAGTTKIKATQAEYNGYASSETEEITITILEAVTWNWDVLYYGATHTNPLIVDPSITEWSLTLEDDRPAIINAFTADQVNHTYTMALPLNKVEVEQQVKFMFRSGDNEVPLFAELSDLRLLTACVDSDDRYNALNWEASRSSYSEGVVTFISTSSQTSSWTMQFYGTPSKVTFTPSGANLWQVLEGANANNMTPVAHANWTKYPAEKEVTLQLNPNTRFVKFVYGSDFDDSNNEGTLAGICVHKLTIESNESVVYLPVGMTKEVVVKHSASTKLVPNSSNADLSCSAGNPVSKNGYYETTLTLSATTAGNYTLSAAENEVVTTIQVIAFDPMGLPIKTDDWKDNTDKADYYHFYVEESQNAYWWNDPTNPYIVFENTGSIYIARSVTFAFEGAPSVIKFNYDKYVASNEWTVEEYNIKTQKWSAAVGVRTTNDTYFEQELQHTTRKVRLSHKGEFYTESKVSNLIIEGYPKAIINPTELLLTNDEMSKSKTFTITAINLANIKLQVDNPNFTLQYQYINQQGQPVFSSQTTDPISLHAQDNIYPDALGVNKMGDIVVKVTWVGTASVHQGLVTITNLDGEEILGTVKLVGSREFIEYTDDNKGNTGIWTGVPDGVAEGRPTEPEYTLRGSFDPYTYHQVNVRNAFDENKNALFDYLVIYGETTTTTVGDYTIYEADRSRGSNACTPYYVYMRDNDGDGVGDGKRYIYVQLIENANSSTKGWLIDGDDALVVPDKGAVSVYVTGFCPYATTGSTKDDEGVLYFRGPAGSRVDVYLEDCHIYSRNKSITGQKYGKNDAEAPEFTYDVVQGSGAVLVFENTIADLNNPPAGTFDVAIHTIGHNILKSNYGAYNNPFGIASNVKIAQVSATVQVRLGERNHYEVAKTVLDFDDKWPTSPTRNDKGEYTSTYRTNGFLSLQKQANHAPSIDLGNANTVVNFRGGRVELQNAEIVSPNYKTTLAISHRTGIMGNIKDFSFPYGLGTDDVGGTVNFYDGTTTVIPMEIDPAYRDFYLMDEDKPTRTSCLRTPANTFIYGGSHCMLRACKYVTSRGGAPTDGAGNFLGLYKYPSASWNETKADGTVVPHKGGWTEINGGNGRVTIPSGNLPNANYGTESITPNTNNTSNNTSDDYLNFWVPEGYDDNVVIEVDKLIRTWLACMTEIQGGLLGVNARVGGDEYIGEDDEIQNLLYCQLDDYIYGVISATNGVTSSGDPIYTYSAPAINPTSSAENPSYETVPLTSVSDYKQHNVISESDYEVTKKVYYVTTAKTDTWMNFTMPFDVEKIWMLEPYSEADIKTKFNEFKAEDEALANEGKLDKKSPNYLSPMERTKMWQAQHNADFAAFFGMAMAIGQHGKDFNDIYNDYYTWAKNHADAGKYTGDYDLRGLYELEHYNGSNFTDSHYFLYKNMGDWTLDEYEEVAAARWEVAPAVGADSILMNKGETYSMLFPYCTGCDVEYKQNSSTGEWELVVDEFGLPKIVERDYWDYWSGKLLIFESTNGDPDPNTQDDNRPHTIKGSNYIAPSKVDSDTPWIFDGLMISDENYDAAVLTGNSTFSTMSVEDYEEVRDYIFTYDDTPYVETFLPAEIDELTGNPIYESLNPTESFLVAHYHKPVKLITRNGRVVTEGSEDQGNDNSGTTTGGHMPTVGGGHSMFITGFDGGINVAVATPQQVRVISATGTILYSGYVNDNVDIPLPINGIYIVKGETEVQKIFY